MKGLILAAGKGTRLRPLTYGRTKSMLKVANKPILEHIILAFKDAGIKEIVVIVGSDEIEGYFKQKDLGVKLEFVIQKEALGTAHAIGMAEKKLKGDFVAANGDNLTDSETISKLIKQHKAPVTMVVFNTPNISELCSVVVEGEKVDEIIEKPEGEAPSPLGGTGIYAFSQEIFGEIKKLEKSKRGEYEITDAVQNLIKNGKKVSWFETKFWYHISYPWDLLKANKALLENLEGENLAEVEENVSIKGKLIAGEGTVIKSGVYIEGDVAIGKNCTIGPNCYIRGSTSIGDNCRVGQAVELKNSIIMPNTNVSHLTYIGDSIIGSNCNFGAGNVLANLRFDEKEIFVNKIQTGLRKLGSIVGDNTKFGANVVVNPGRLIGPNAKIWPGKMVDKDVKPDTEFR